MFEGNTVTRSWGIYNVNADHDFGIIRYGGAGNKLMFSIDRTTDTGFFNGKFAIGAATPLITTTLRVMGNIDGGVVGWGVLNDQTIASTVTTSARVFQSSVTTQAATFTLSDLYHFLVSPAVFGAGSTVTNQVGFYVNSGLTGATNNYAFRSDVAAATGRWNLYMGGTADNYLAGNLWIGTTGGTNTLDVNGTARIRTIANFGATPAEVLVPSATGVIQKRTLTEFVGDLNVVTISTTQTITGTKTFGNALLTQIGSNPILRLTTTDNNATIHFRNVFNDDAATIWMDAVSEELAFSTNVDNYNIRIQPHGTGSIILPNVAAGTGDVLMLDGSNKVVRGTVGPSYNIDIGSSIALTPETGAFSSYSSVYGAIYIRRGNIGSLYISFKTSSIQQNTASGRVYLEITNAALYAELQPVLGAAYANNQEVNFEFTSAIPWTNYPYTSSMGAVAPDKIIIYLNKKVSTSVSEKDLNNLTYTLATDLQYSTVLQKNYVGLEYHFIF